MAYDANDPDTKAALEAAVKEAVKEATEGLSNKNAELLNEVKTLKKGKAIDPAEVETLETKLEEATSKLAEATKRADKAEKSAKEAGDKLVAADKRTSDLAKSNGIKAAMASANVAKQFMPAVEAMLEKQVTVKEVDGVLTPFVGDKPLSDHIAVWSQSDDGKHFIASANNGGGGANGDGGAKPGAKTMTRAAFDALDPAAKRQASVVDKVVLTD